MSKTRLLSTQETPSTCGKIVFRSFGEDGDPPFRNGALTHQIKPKNLSHHVMDIRSVILVMMMGLGFYSEMGAQCTLGTTVPANRIRIECSGENVTFRQNYTIASEPTVTWQYNDDNVGDADGPDNIVGWRPISGSGALAGISIISGNFTSAYTQLALGIPGATYEEYEFRVLFDGGSCSNVISGEFSYDLNGTFEFDTHPTTANICETTSSKEFLVAVDNTLPGTLTYLWQYSATGVAPWTSMSNVNASGSGFNTANLNLNDTHTAIWPSAGSSVFVRCRVTKTGCANQFSNAAELSIDGAPTITGISDDVTICSSGSTDLTATLGGSANEITWSGTGTFSAPTGSPVTYSNATSGTYTITATTNTNGECAADIEEVDVNVQNLSIVSQSAVPNLNRCAGQPVTLSVIASSSTTITYQWQVNTGSGFVDISGEENASLVLSGVTAEMDGNIYQCVTSTEECTDTSDPFTLNVDGPIEIITQPVSVTDICITQAEATFTVGATTGSGTLTYQWQSSLTGLAPWTDISGEVSASYTIQNTDDLWPDALGGSTYFRCVVNAGVCTVVNSGVAQLGISADGPVTVDAGADQFICKDGTVTLSGLVSPSDVGSWSSSNGGTFSDVNAPGINSPSTFTPPSGFTGDITLTLTSYEPDGDCPMVSDDVVITVVGVDVGSNLATCYGDDPLDIVATISGTGDDAGLWSSSTGATGFGDPSMASTNYTPGSVDEVETLTFTHTASGCSDDLVLTVNKITLTTSSKARTVCEGSALPSGTPFRQNRDTNPNSNGSTDTWEFYDNGDAMWKSVASLPDAGITLPTVTGGTGQTNLYFAGPIPYNTIYNGLTLRVTITEGECTETVEGFVLTVTQAPVANAGGDVTMCYDGDDITLVAGAGSTTPGSWSVSGNAGTLLDNIYTPADGDKGQTLTFTYTAEGSGVCADDTDSKTITFHYIDVSTHVPGSGSDYTRTICETTGTTNFQYNYTSAPLAANPTGSVTWEYRESVSGIWGPANTAPIFDNIASSTRLNLKDITLLHNGYQFRATVVAGECSVTSEVFTLVVRPLGMVSAGDNASVCIVGNTVPLNGMITGDGYSILNWTSSDGTGSFDDATSLTAVYTPGSDLVATLTLRSNNPDGGQGCPAVESTMTVTKTANSSAINAGPDVTICAGSDYNTVGTIDMTTVFNANWTTTGDGSFDIPGGISGAEYTPGSNDIAAGYVDLVLTSDHVVGDCANVQDTVRVTIASFGFTTYVPESKEVNTCEEENVALEVSFTSVTAPTVAWEMFDGIDWVAAIGSVTTTATTTTLEFEADALTHDGKTFRVTLDASGCTQVISDEFTVNVNGNLEIVSTPTDDLENCGTLEEITFTAVATTDVGTITYQWQYSDDGGLTFNNIEGATNATLELTNAATFWPGLGESILLKMIASLPFCSSVETVPFAFGISAQPAPDVEAGDNQTVCAGDIVNISGQILSSGTAAAWYPINDNGVFANNLNLTSVMETTYTPGSVALANGTVTLRLQGSVFFGECTFDIDDIIITISNGSIGTTVPATGLLTRCEGTDATFRVNFFSPVLPIPQIPTIVWQRNGVDIVDDAKYDILDGGSATQSRLRVNDVTDTDEGLYTVSVTYPGCDPETRTFTLSVVDGPIANVGGPYAPKCAGDMIMLDGTVGGSATEGTWSSATGGIFTAEDLEEASATYTPSAADITAGSVVLTLTSNGAVSGCPVDVKTVTVDIHSITPAAISLTSPQCDGEVLSITSTWTKGTTTPVAETATWEVSTDGGATYLPFAGTSVVNTAGQSVLTFTAVSGAYLYRARIVSGACNVTTNAVTLTVNGPVVFDTHPTSVLNVCQSTTEMEFTSSATNSGTGTITYRWQYSNNGTTGWTNVAISVDGYNTTTLTVDSGDGVAWPVTGNISGKYYRLVANLTGCPTLYTSNAAQFTISNDAAPIVTVPADGIQCKGTIASLTGAITTPATSATWTTSGSGTISNPPGNYVGATYTPGANETGDVTFTLTSNDPAGVCPSAVESFTVTYIDVNAGADINVCIDGSELDAISLAGTVTGVSSPIVVWSDGGALGTFIPDASTLGAMYTPVSSAAPITLTLSSNGCSDDVIVKFNENIIIATVPSIVTECVGDNRNFDVLFTPNIAAPALTRVWEYNDDDAGNIDGVPGFQTLTIAAPYSTPTFGTSQDARLTVTGITSTMDNMKFRVVLTNGDCSATSGAFTLRVNSIENASAGTDLAICETSANAMFSGSSVTTGPSTAGHQWRWSASEAGTYNTVTGTGASGQTTQNLTLSGTWANWPAVGTPIYLRLRVSKTGCNSLDSAPIAFTRDEAPTVTAGTPETICETGTATMAGTMGGSASSITWSSDKAAGSFDDATSLTAVYTPGEPGVHTLTITSDDPTGACEAATANVIITVEDQVVVNAGLDQAVCQAGSPLDVILSGSATPSDADVTWTASSGTFDDENILGATYTPDGSTQQVTLTLTPTQTVCTAIPDQVVISLGDGITLLSYTPGDATTAGSRTVCNGGSTTFRVDFDPTVLATIQWQVNGTPLTIANASSFGIGGWSVTNTDTYAQLSLTGLSVDANGRQISLMVTDRGCSATFGNFTLNVNGPVTFSTQPDDIGVCATALSASFSGIASNSGAGGSPTYQWQYYNGSIWVNVPNTVAGFNGPNLFLTNAATTIWPEAGNSVDLRLNATVPTCGSKSSDVATLTVTNNPCGGVNLTPNFTPSQSGAFSAVGITKDFVITVQNTLPGNSIGEIQVFVPFVSGYNLSFDPFQSSATVTSGNVSVNNSSWTVIEISGVGFLISTSNVISGNSSLNFAVKVTSSAVMLSGNVSAALNPSSGGQTDFSDDNKSKFIITF
jgi:hypothetical protein